ncbi:MAG: glycoside hydrolase [candidate division WOR-3 bacterium]|nr:glycoside hydrolase [candidate division WOR-3 bacterium]MCX7837152.1 glycoside hydrolase [candidate division WOR-3 bacterium]MDW8114350.1 sialidase family protein [candidate division WOR-3 bacterium]
MKKLILLLFLILIYFSFSFSQERSDTVMLTYYDWQVLSHMKQRIYYDQGYGVHVIAQVSYQPYPFPDRNIYYNFFDERLNMWAYGQQGVPIFPFRVGYGVLDVNPNNHNAYCVAHFGSVENFSLVLASLNVPIEFCTIRVRNYDLMYPSLAITNNGWFHIVASKEQAGSQYEVCYIRMREWCLPEEPRLIIPRPGEPIACVGDYYGIFASKRSNKVALFWTEFRGNSGTDSGAYRISFNGGDTWSPVIPFPFPAIFTPGSETLPEVSFAYGFFDREDNPNFVICYIPNINGIKHILPVEMWHYQPGRNPELTRICRISADTLAGSVNIYDIFAARPTIAQESQTGVLYVVWEQFDSLNYEPQTGRLRADIWISYSLDNGFTWSTPQRITQPNQTSKRYPCLAPIVDRENNLWITYLADSVAGFYVQGEGPGSLNPIIVKKVRILVPTINEDKFYQKIKNEKFLAGITIYDASGKRISKKTLNSKGVYFLVEIKDKKIIKKKIINF